MNRLKSLCNKVVKSKSSKSSNSLLDLAEKFADLTVSNANQQSCSTFQHVRFFGLIGEGPMDEIPDVNFETKVENFCQEHKVALTDANLLGLDIGSDHTGTAVIPFLQPASGERLWQIEHLDKSGAAKDPRLFGNQFANMCIRHNIVGVVVGHVPTAVAQLRMNHFLEVIRTDHWVQGMPYIIQNESFTSKDAKADIEHARSSPSHEAILKIKDWEKQNLNALKNNQSALLILQSYQGTREAREAKEIARGQGQ